MRQEQCTVISSNISFTRGLPLGALCLRNLLQALRRIRFPCIWFANKYLGAYSPQTHNVSLPLLISTLYLSLDLTDGLCLSLSPPIPNPSLQGADPSSTNYHLFSFSKVLDIVLAIFTDFFSYSCNNPRR